MESAGIEPATVALKGRCSTTELRLRELAAAMRSRLKVLYRFWYALFAFLQSSHRQYLYAEAVPCSPLAALTSF
jgi:hypothetical protein